MNQPESTKLRGIANLFKPDELRNFFTNYLTTLLVIEGLIFFAAFVYHLASDGVLFPWKPYLFAAFLAPVAITFVFGIIVLCFNTYLYEPGAAVSGAETGEESGSAGGRVDRFIRLANRLPFLLSLLLLLLSGALLYKLDAILLFVAQAGERAIHYLLIGLAVLLGVAAVGGLVWMLLSYNLRKKKLDHQYRYRQEVMETLGLVILEDDTVVGRDGRPIPASTSLDMDVESKTEGEVTFLPKLPRR